jgi:two-component system chemotaxis response regulator CheY
MVLDGNFLIVDDEVVIRKIIANFLKKAGYVHFDTAEDGVQAIEALKNNEIDIIIADWNMPNLNGLALLDRVRENERWKKIPFIMLTAEAHEDNVMVAGLHKATDYIVKPFTADTLLKKVAKALGNSEAFKIKK